MNRIEFERKVIDIVSKYTYLIVTQDQNIQDDLGIDSIYRAAIEEDIKDEFNIDLHWSIWDNFWHTKPTVAELCDFIELKLCMQ